MIIAGIILLAISLSTVPHDQNLINTAVQLPANQSNVERAVSASYFLGGGGSGKISGSLLMAQQCCVSFYIFTDSSWRNFVSNDYNATNSTNSPTFTVNASAIDAKNGISPTFTFVPNPSDTYQLIFFNQNRSLWDSNSSVIFHVIAFVTLYYSVAPAKSLIYPAVVLIIVGAILIVVRKRVPK